MYIGRLDPTYRAVSALSQFRDKRLQPGFQRRRKFYANERSKHFAHRFTGSMSRYFDLSIFVANTIGVPKLSVSLGPEVRRPMTCPVLLKMGPPLLPS